MPETRYITTYTYPEGLSAEESIPENAVITYEPYEVSDEELAIEQVESEVKEANDNALIAYQHFDSLTLAQKNKILKGLLGDFISRNRENYV